MSLKEGELTSSDLSPNAGILGTQIADNTIQLRNLTDDTFRVVKILTSTIPGFTVTSPGAGAWNSNSSQVAVAHNLGYIPAYLAFVGSSDTVYLAIPCSSAGGSGGIWAWNNYFVDVDSTNVTFVREASVFGNTTFSAFDQPVKIYLLQEKASIT